MLKVNSKLKYIFDNMKNTISLVILDVMMPFCDGWSVLMHIRNNDKKIPVMMLTVSAGGRMTGGL